MTIAYLFIAAMVAAALYFAIRYFIRARQEFAGEQVVVCHETGKRAMVEMDARLAALHSLWGTTDSRL